MPQPTESTAISPGWWNAVSKLGYALSVDRRSRLGLIVMGLAAILFLANVLRPGQPAPLAAAVAWLVFGGLTGWGGALLVNLLHPERAAVQKIEHTCNRLAQSTADPWLLLARVTGLLHDTLKTRGLSLWQVDLEDRVLLLVHAEGRLPADNLTELPLDLPPDQLNDIWPVNALPESALRHGLHAAGIQTVAWLRFGQELVGAIGFGPARFHFQTEILSPVAAQLALLTKNALLALNLEETLHKLRLAYRRTIDAQDDERRNLAAELHDDILGRLTTMALTLRRSQHRLAGDLVDVQHWLAECEAESQSLNRRLREITQGLHPSVLTDLGLISALRAYLDSLARTPGGTSGPQTITLTAQGFDSDRIATPKLERDLYYITRQAMDNAIEHAQAGQIFVHLRWDTDAINVTVRDTGRGMAAPPEQLMGQDGHLGLLSMQERTMAWQGRLTFHTGPQQGTTVRVRLPVDQPSTGPAHLQAYTQYFN